MKLIGLITDWWAVGPTRSLPLHYRRDRPLAFSAVLRWFAASSILQCAQKEIGEGS